MATQFTYLNCTSPPMPDRDSFVVGPDPTRPGWAKLALNGAVTVASAAALHRAAVGLAAGGGSVAVCLAGAEHVDAAALQVLLCLGREVEGRGGRCELTGTGGPVADLLRLAGLGGAP